MNKIEITKAILKSTGLDYDESKFTQYYTAIWQNTRHKTSAGYRLTDSGFKLFKEGGDITFYQITFSDNIVLTSQIILFLDKFIDCPYYFDSKDIWVTSDKMALQLMLFDGDVEKFGKIKTKSKEKTQKSVDI